jgi:hypothetical protein
MIALDTKESQRLVDATDESVNWWYDEAIRLGNFLIGLDLQEGWALTWRTGKRK